MAAAPILDTSASPKFTAIIENSGVPSGAVGTLVSALIDSGGPLIISAIAMETHLLLPSLPQISLVERFISLLMAAARGATSERFLIHPREFFMPTTTPAWLLFQLLITQAPSVI